MEKKYRIHFKLNGVKQVIEFREFPNMLRFSQKLKDKKVDYVMFG